MHPRSLPVLIGHPIIANGFRLFSQAAYGMDENALLMTVSRLRSMMRKYGYNIIT